MPTRRLRNLAGRHRRRHHSQCPRRWRRHGGISATGALVRTSGRRARTSCLSRRRVPSACLVHRWRHRTWPESWHDISVRWHQSILLPRKLLIGWFRSVLKAGSHSTILKVLSANKILYMDCAQSWTTPIRATNARNSGRKICPSYPYFSFLLFSGIFFLVLLWLDLYECIPLA